MGTGCEGTQAAGSPCPPQQAPLPSRLGKLLHSSLGSSEPSHLIVLSVTLQRAGIQRRVLAAELVHPARSSGLQGVTGVRRKAPFQERCCRG